jgi:hypothetical protein
MIYPQLFFNHREFTNKDTLFCMSDTPKMQTDMITLGKSTAPQTPPTLALPFIKISGLTVGGQNPSRMEKSYDSF